MRAESLNPIPETNYLRVLYVGKLQLNERITVEDSTHALQKMMSDIWKFSQIHNHENFISGHLSFTKTLHVAQLLEGPEEAVLELMERIRKDVRVNIHREFSKKLLTANRGWKLSRCYSFHITDQDLELIENPNISLGQLFDMIPKTYETKQFGLKLPEFYKKTVDSILLKFIYNDRSTRCLCLCPCSFAAIF